MEATTKRNLSSTAPLQLEVYSHNERGLRAYEKNGFKREGVLREALYYQGAFSDEIIMAIIRSDYLKVKL